MKFLNTWRLYGLLGLGIAALAGAFLYRQQAEANLQLQVARQEKQKEEIRQLENLQAKLKALQSAVMQTPQNVEARWRLADAYSAIGQVSLTRQQLHEIEKLSPRDPSPLVALANIELAQKELTNAESTFRKAVQKFPKVPSAWQGLSATLFHEERYFEALEAARQSVKFGPRDPNNSYVLASAAMEYGLQFPDPQLHSAALNEARDKFASLLKVWPQQGIIYFNLGRICVGLRDSRSAMKYLRRAIEIEPQKAEHYFLLARVLNVSGSPKAALDTIKQGLQKNPRHAGLQALNGQLLQISGQKDSAQKSYEAFQLAVEAEPGNAGYREKLGIACLRLGKLDDARVQFEEALRLNPAGTVPHQQLSAIYTRQGKPEKATKFATASTQMFFNDNQLKQIHGLAKLHPQSVPLHLILADRYRDLGFTGAARDEYLYVLQLDPANQKAKIGSEKLTKILAQQQKSVSQKDKGQTISTSLPSVSLRPPSESESVTMAPHATTEATRQ